VLHIFRAPASVLHKLNRLEWAVLLLEMTGLLAFLRGSGRAARPLVGTGPKEQGAQFWGLVLGSGLALPWLVKTFSLFGRRSHNSVISVIPYISHKRGIDETWRNAFQVLPSLLVIIGGFFLRRTLVKAGHTSSQDARTTLWNAKR